MSLWLTGEAAWFGLPGRAEDFTLDLATPLDQLLAAVVASGLETVRARHSCAHRADELIRIAADLGRDPRPAPGAGAPLEHAG